MGQRLLMGVGTHRRLSGRQGVADQLLGAQNSLGFRKVVGELGGVRFSFVAISLFQCLGDSSVETDSPG